MSGLSHIKRGLGLLALTAALAACGKSGPDGLPGESIAGDKGPAGEPGAEGRPSITSITPKQVFIDRVVDVTLSGSGTHWTDQAVIDFGDGVQVLDLHVASPTALVATIAVQIRAALGLRQVRVTQGDDTASYTGAFRIDAPLQVQTYINGGSYAQGSMVWLGVRQQDAAAPFDDNPTNFEIFAGGHSRTADIVPFFGGEFVSPFNADAAIFLDVNGDVGQGAVDIIAESGPPGFEPTRSVAPLALPVRERAPYPAAMFTINTAQVKEWHESVLFELDVPAPALLQINALPSELSKPQLMVLPESGKWSDYVAAGFPEEPSLSFFAKAGKYYLIYLEVSDFVGHDIEFDVSAQPIPEITPPQTVSEFSFPGDELRLYRVAASAGQTLSVTTSDGVQTLCFPNGPLYTGIEILDDEFNLLAVEFPPQPGCASISYPITTTGDYLVRVQAGNIQFPDFVDYSVTFELL